MNMMLRTDIIPLAQRLRGPCFVVVDAGTRELPERYLRAVDSLLISSHMMPALYEQVAALYEQVTALPVIDDSNEMLRTALSLQKKNSVLAAGAAAGIALTVFMNESRHYIKSLTDYRVKTISLETLESLQVLFNACVSHGIVVIPHGVFRV